MTRNNQREREIAKAAKRDADASFRLFRKLLKQRIAQKERHDRP